MKTAALLVCALMAIGPAEAQDPTLVREVAAAFPGEMRSISFGQPTLEDVFVQRTGHRFDGDGNDDRVSPP